MSKSTIKKASKFVWLETWRELFVQAVLEKPVRTALTLATGGSAVINGAIAWVSFLPWEVQLTLWGCVFLFICGLATILHSIFSTKRSVVLRTRNLNKKTVHAGGYVEDVWHGRKLKVTLNAITELKFESPKIETESGTLSYGEDRTVKVAELDVFWGGATIHSTDYIPMTKDGCFLVPQAVEENEDYSSVFAFWNTERAFWFLSVWVSHINSNQQVADINYAMVVLE